MDKVRWLKSKIDNNSDTENMNFIIYYYENHLLGILSLLRVSVENYDKFLESELYNRLIKDRSVSIGYNNEYVYYFYTNTAINDLTTINGGDDILFTLEVGENEDDYYLFHFIINAYAMIQTIEENDNFYALENKLEHTGFVEMAYDGNLMNLKKYKLYIDRNNLLIISDSEAADNHTVEFFYMDRHLSNISIVPNPDSEHEYSLVPNTSSISIEESKIMTKDREEKTFKITYNGDGAHIYISKDTIEDIVRFIDNDKLFSYSFNAFSRKFNHLTNRIFKICSLGGENNE